MLRHALACLIAVLLTGFAVSASAQVGADLNISPKRVVFSPGDRTATVYVFNQGDEAATYVIDITDRVMTTDGQIDPIANGAARPAWSAAADLQYTPRRVTLPPKANQAIRIRLTAPPQGEERRSHLTVTALPPEETGLTAQAAATAGPDALSLRVIGLFSVSIPIIVRDTLEPSTAQIAEARLLSPPEPAGKPRLAFTLKRQGATSVYGDLEVYVGEGKKERLMGKTRGVAVYPEIGERLFNLPLAEPLARGERLRIVYRDDDLRPGTELAAVTLVAP